MTDEFTRGFLEGVEVAARIFRNHIGVRRTATYDQLGRWLAAEKITPVEETD